MTDAKTASIYSRRSALQLMIAGAAGLAGSNLLDKPAFARTSAAKPTGRIIPPRTHCMQRLHAMPHKCSPHSHDITPRQNFFLLMTLK